jgi:hypothetical protein
LRLFQELGHPAGMLAAVESIGGAALTQRQNERAARLLAAVEALREALSLPGPDWWRRPRERIGEAMRVVSLQEAFAAAWAAGRALSLDEAITYALDETREG